MLDNFFGFITRPVTQRHEGRSFGVRPDLLEDKIRQAWAQGISTADMASRWVLPQSVVANTFARMRDGGRL